MLTETSIPGTDDWWLMQLAADFGADLPRLHRMQSYADGTNDLPEEADQNMRDAYRRFLHTSRLNLADLVVSTKVSRMKPQGFRTAAPDDEDGDAIAWATWKRSGMKVGVRDFFTNAGVLGQAYLTTTGPQVANAEAQPLIVPSSGFTTVTRQYALQPWLSEAAFSYGYDPINGADLITLYRPGYIRTAARAAKKTSVPANGRKWSPGREWAWVSDPIPLGYTDRVPVFRMSGPGGKGMFEKHTDSLDRINADIRDRLTITAMQAFIQRGITGDLPDVYPQDHPQAGQKVNYDDIFKAGPAALWKLPAGVEIWESKVTDITPILTGTKDDQKAFASATSTPIYILSPDAANASAEGAKAGGEAFQDSVEEWIDRADMPIALAQSAAFEALGDTVRAAVGDIETLWGPVARSSVTDRASAAAQAKAGGASQRYINRTIWGMSPDEAAQERQFKSDEQFDEALAG
jgi:hypothetical protein